MLKQIITFASLFFLIFSCKENPKTTQKSSENKITYLYNDSNQSFEIPLKQTPQRIATFSPPATEFLLALSLGEKIVIASTEEPVLPQYQKDYEKIPQKLIGHSFKMNREAFLLSEPDFVVAYPYDLKSEALGTPEELLKQGISPFVLESNATSNATLETVFKDILKIGKIFSVEDISQKLVRDMKHQLNSTQLIQPKKENEKPKVMVINSFNNGVWIGGALATDLISRAYGINVYSDVPGDGEWVSYESMLARNPDVIFITDIESRPMKYDEKVKILKSNSILRDISAVKNNRIYKANVGDLAPGVRNVDFIIRMNKIFYQNGK